MKRGFTLIELLAVIVILAIISLIAVPIVINIINDAKEESQKRSIDMYAKIIEQAIAKYNLTSSKPIEGLFEVDGKSLKQNDIVINLDYNGDVVCNNTAINNQGKIFLSNCYVNGEKSNYFYNAMPNMLMENKFDPEDNEYDLFLNTGIYTGYINTLIFHNKIEIPNEYEKKDCSFSQDESVMCYWKEDSDDEEFYEMNIAANGEVYSPFNSSGLFYQLSYDAGTGIVDLSELNTKYTTDMSYMFMSAYPGEFSLGNKFNTSKVTNMSHMFEYSSISIDTFTNFDTSNVKDMSYIFSNTDLNNFDIINNLDTSNVKNMSHMLEYMYINSPQGEGPYFLNIDTSNANDISYILYGFNSYSNNKVIINLGTKFDTSKVTNMEGAFKSANLKQLNLGNNFDTSKVTNMSHMFERSGVKELNLGTKFDTSKVTNMEGMFSNIAYAQDTYATINLGSNFDTSKVTNMSHMFERSKIKQLNLGDKFDTSKVTNMSYMFKDFTYIITSASSNSNTFSLGGNFDTSNVTNMSHMFDGNMSSCSFLCAFNLNLGSKFDTSKVTNMSYMFSNWAGFADSINLGTKFNTSKVTNMSYMFYKTAALVRNLNLGNNFYTENVTDMSYMFYGLYDYDDEYGGADSYVRTLNLGTNFTIPQGANITKIFYLGWPDDFNLIVHSNELKTKILSLDDIPNFWKNTETIIVQ